MLANRYVVVGGVVALAVVLLLVKKNPAGVGAAVGGAAVDLAGGFVAGASEGIGDVFGVPRTDETECEKAIREGRYWDASFACPAGTFVGAAAGGVTDTVKGWFE
jgi:hypothetical protein